MKIKGKFYEREILSFYARKMCIRDREYAVWKDGFLHVKIVADYPSDVDDWEQTDQFLSVQDEEKSELTSLSRYCNYDEEQKQLTVEQEYRSITLQDQYMLNLFEQAITIHMMPVPEYSSLKEIGTPVTHNGRTWVFQGTWEDDETFRLHAWGTSGDIWQMGRPMKEPVTPEDVKTVSYTHLDLDENTFEQEAEALKELCASYRVPYVVNDSVEIAMDIDADGVHVGQSDIKGRDIRAMIGPDKILGISAGTVEEAQAAEKAGADYIGVGAVFGTSTKKNARNLSLEKLQEISLSLIHI